MSCGFRPEPEAKSRAFVVNCGLAGGARDLCGAKRSLRVRSAARSPRAVRHKCFLIPSGTWSGNLGEWFSFFSSGWTTALETTVFSEPDLLIENAYAILNMIHFSKLAFLRDPGCALVQNFSRGDAGQPRRNHRRAGYERSSASLRIRGRTGRVEPRQALPGVGSLWVPVHINAGNHHVYAS